MTSQSNEQITNIDREKLRDCFREFTDDGEYASVSQLPSMIEYLHYPLPENFYEKACIDFQLKENQKFDFDKFCEFLAPRNRDTDEWKKLHDAFEVFDNNGNGKISISELSEILITFGDAFTTDEINHMKAIAKPDENDLIDINLITDLLVDDMFDHLEEEEEEENFENGTVKEQNGNYKNQSNNYQNKPSNNQKQQNDYQEKTSIRKQQQNDYQEKTRSSKQQQIDDQEKSSIYQQQQPNEYQMQSNYSQQSNEYQGQSNEYQDQYNDDQGQYTDDQGQYYDYQGQSNEYQEQPDYYQDQYEQAEEEEIYDQNEVYNDSNN